MRHCSNTWGGHCEYMCEAFCKTCEVWKSSIGMCPPPRVALFTHACGHYSHMRVACSHTHVRRSQKLATGRVARVRMVANPNTLTALTEMGRTWQGCGAWGGEQREKEGGGGGVAEALATRVAVGSALNDRE